MVLHALTSLTYVVVAVARRLGYIGDYVKLMESFVVSFTPHRVGRRCVQGLSLIHIGGLALTIQGLTEHLPETLARAS